MNWYKFLGFKISREHPANMGVRIIIFSEERCPKKLNLALICSKFLRLYFFRFLAFLNNGNKFGNCSAPEIHLQNGVNVLGKPQRLGRRCYCFKSWPLFFDDVCEFILYKVKHFRTPPKRWLAR